VLCCAFSAYAPAPALVLCCAFSAYFLEGFARKLPAPDSGALRQQAALAPSPAPLPLRDRTDPSWYADECALHVVKAFQMLMSATPFTTFGQVCAPASLPLLILPALYWYASLPPALPHLWVGTLSTPLPFTTFGQVRSPVTCPHFYALKACSVTLPSSFFLPCCPPGPGDSELCDPGGGGGCAGGARGGHWDGARAAPAAAGARAGGEAWGRARLRITAVDIRATPTHRSYCMLTTAERLEVSGDRRVSVGVCVQSLASIYPHAPLLLHVVNRSCVCPSPLCGVPWVCCVCPRLRRPSGALRTWRWASCPPQQAWT